MHIYMYMKNQGEIRQGNGPWTDTKDSSPYATHTCLYIKGGVTKTNNCASCSQRKAQLLETKARLDVTQR